MIHLSEEQAKAAYTESKNALCIACAGSGKTRTLIARIQHLIENCKVSPYEIVSISFTRKAAGEMRERLKDAIGTKAHHVSIGTIHSYALSMIQRFGDLVGLRPNRITVYSEWEEQFLLKDVCEELGYYDGKKYKGTNKKDISKAFFLYYTEGIRTLDSSPEQSILNAFLSRCKENNALTYGTILTTFSGLIPLVSQYLNYQHILVDEVQDNDKLQWGILNYLCMVTNASLFAVGDFQQSIYSFRGADPDYMIRNKDKFNVYTLEDNYRCDAEIVAVANKLINRNKNNLSLVMKPKRPGQFLPSHLPNMDSNAIAKNISLSVNMGFEEEITVLGRNHFLLEKLSVLLSAAGIDHDYFGRKKALTMSEDFRRVHAFLKLMVNPFDNFSFLLIRDTVGVTKENYSEIRLNSVKEMRSHFQEWIRTRPDMDAIYNDDFEGTKMMSDAFESIKKIDFGFETERVFGFTSAYLDENPNKSVQDYLNWLAIYDVQDEMDDEPKQVRLMTVHASKGLEFKNVVIAGMNEGILPSKHAKFSQEELESELRLAYVAITRAENTLVMTSRPVEDKYGDIKYPVSRFVKWGLSEN